VPCEGRFRGARAADRRPVALAGITPAWYAQRIRRHEVPLEIGWESGTAQIKGDIVGPLIPEAEWVRS